MANRGADSRISQQSMQGTLFSEEEDFSLSVESSDGGEPGDGGESGATVFSIGHSTRKLEAFLNALEKHSIERLVDIRHFPRSRRNPQFDQPSLREALTASGIEYLWLEELGGYREGGYVPYMNTADFASGLARFEAMAREKRTTCMCAELKWHQCHRRHVAEALADRGWRVVHIIDDSRAELHRREKKQAEGD